MVDTTKTDPRDTTVGIWDYLYKVRIPDLQSRSVEDIRENGVRITGVEHIDKAMSKNKRTVYINIDEMVEYYRNGVPIQVIDPKDTKAIYDAISKHIYAWQDYIKNGVNLGSAPIEDLILMDQFANTVYEHAKYLFQTDSFKDLVKRHFGGYGGIVGAFGNSQGNSMSDPHTSGQLAPPPKLDDREELGDFFQDRLTFIRRR